MAVQIGLFNSSYLCPDLGGDVRVMTKSVNICGVPHKIGNKGFVYRFVNGEWVHSSKPKDEVQRHLKRVLVSSDD